MKRKALYSRATRTRRAASSVWAGNQADKQSPSDWAVEFDDGPSVLTLAWGGIKRFYRHRERPVLVAVSVLLSLGAIGMYSLLNPRSRALTQNDIDAAVQYTISNTPEAPADSARAADIIRPSVVEVEGFLSPQHAAEIAQNAAKSAAKNAKSDKTAPKEHPENPQDKKSADAKAPTLPDRPLAANPGEPRPDAIGSGVVVDEGGKILTSLHVISSTDRWVVVFADGTESDADFVGAQAENDLAVLQPKHIPDELQPAILASTAGLKPGDEVVATGFPFGIGPSVSAGVVSGLGREFVDPDDDRPKLTNLIQFDAAVNPGNSGGPLVNRDGEVVGIVAAIVNPSGARVFAGIGFAVPIENAARAVGENPL